MIDRGIMFPPFYLLYSSKISIESEGKIGWTYYPEEVDERLKFRDLFWRGV